MSREIRELEAEVPENEKKYLVEIKLLIRENEELKEKIEKQQKEYKQFLTIFSDLIKIIETNNIDNNESESESESDSEEVSEM